VRRHLHETPDIDRVNGNAYFSGTFSELE